MNTKTIELLADWVRGLIKEAELDTNLSYSQFTATEYDNSPFVIVGGWSEGFNADYSDILYVSKSQPAYAMCVKIATKENNCASTDFDLLRMPVYKYGEVDDTCVALERGEDPDEAAKFFLMEFERVNKEHEADLYRVD